MKRFTVLAKIIPLFFVLVLILSTATACSSSEENAVSDARNGVVRVIAVSPAGNSVSSGTAFGIGTAGEETSHFVTNWHVITGEGEWAIGEGDIYILLSNDAVTTVLDYVRDADGNVICDAEGNPVIDSFISDFDTSKMIRCQILYSADTYPDVAILKAERTVPGRVALTLKSSRYVPIASQVYSLGYPAAADDSSLSQTDLTAYYYADVESVHINGGIVSKLGAFALFGNTYCVEHDAHINGGNSGGPLVDNSGYVVGINTYGIGSDEFLNYSVYIDYAMDYLNQLGIPYDYVVPEEPFPVVPTAIGGAVVLVLIIVLVVILNARKPGKQPAVDIGLRVQYDSGALLSGKRYVINTTLRFGRAADCNIRYPDNAPGISGHHCEITVSEGRVYIRDLNSTHGTYVNGSRIASNQQIPLTEGSVVHLGSPAETFRIARSTKA